jgi:putative resolvase
MKDILTIQEAATFLGVTTKTVRRWEKAGKIKALRTEGGHRRFKSQDLLEKRQTALLTIAYARINHQQPRKDLERQINCLKDYCEHHHWQYKIIQDVGSGVNYKNQGLLNLLALICQGKVEKIILTRKDKLLTIGNDLIFSICELFGVEMVIINCSEEEIKEEDLREDFRDIIASLRNRLYGLRNTTNAKILDEVEAVTQQLCEQP